ncbi:hypothetical protein GCM10007415_35910 [Parapedobacter pyrenivorans]|uniref:ASCH domain-containing protein n=1 Tax=Parapedobacter pyrenivorans TaxID=1305674 RepID=A0A917HZ77_9SPHI|nr:hypothetical protein GCM10007415_35910 [Parapedobacter pyrenivorans]
MLFKNIHLQGIKSGKISLAFRKWQKTALQNGSHIHTAIGLVKINAIEIVDESTITKSDAIKAGFADKKQLLNSLSQHNTGKIFKISISYYAEDPRVKLRERTTLTDEQFSALKQKMERLDNYSKKGYWTKKVLFSIKENPHLHAIGIAKLTGFEKEWLKLNIRKLKNLGLTISHDVGYELSPFGKLVVKKLQIEA